MDHITKQLVDYTAGFSLADVPQAARQAALNHLVDAVGCAIAGYRTASAQIGVRVARTVTSTSRPATVFGADAVRPPPGETGCSSVCRGTARRYRGRG